MFRYLDIWINGAEISLPTAWFIESFSLLFLFLSLQRGLRFIPVWKVLLLVLIPSVSALYGGKLLFHGMIDHQLSLEGQGQAYYGALFFQAFAFWILSVLLIQEKYRKLQALDLFSVASAFVYSLLRMGCFANGCCYGKLCRYPWAVVFKDEDSLTPLLGLPLHPTQLYSMIHGLLMGWILVRLYKKREPLQLQGQLFWLFLMMMGMGRWIIEPFRADLKNTLWHGFAMNLWISFFVILSGMGVFAFRQCKERNGALRFLRTVILPLILFSTIALTGCGVVPKAPGVHVVAQTEELIPGVSVHHMARKSKKVLNEDRNLLFVAVDDAPDVDQKVSTVLSRIYRTQSPPRLEEVLWWYYAKPFARLYQTVVRIRFDSFDWKNMQVALSYLEQAKTPFDLVLLVHGIPNHLVSSKKLPPVSWKDFQSLAGERQLKYLHLVYLQACYGDTLMKEFQEMGAKSVISFHGFHSNLLFFDLFIQKYLRKNGEVDKAFLKAYSSFEKHITHDFLYKNIIKHVFELTPKEYADQITEEGWMPSLLDPKIDFITKPPSSVPSAQLN